MNKFVAYFVCTLIAIATVESSESLRARLAARRSKLKMENAAVLGAGGKSQSLEQVDNQTPFGPKYYPIEKQVNRLLYRSEDNTNYFFMFDVNDQNAAYWCMIACAMENGCTTFTWVNTVVNGDWSGQCYGASDEITPTGVASPGFTSGRFVNGDFTTEPGVNHLLNTIDAPKSENPPQTFYFKLDGFFAQLCAGMCERKQDCTAWTWHRLSDSVDPYLVGHCYGRNDGSQDREIRPHFDSGALPRMAAPQVLPPIPAPIQDPSPDPSSDSSSDSSQGVLSPMGFNPADIINAIQSAFASMIPQGDTSQDQTSSPPDMSSPSPQVQTPPPTPPQDTSPFATPTNPSFSEPPPQQGDTTMTTSGSGTGSGTGSGSGSDNLNDVLDSIQSILQLGNILDQSSQLLDQLFNHLIPKGLIIDVNLHQREHIGPWVMSSSWEISNK